MSAAKSILNDLEAKKAEMITIKRLSLDEIAKHQRIVQATEEMIMHYNQEIKKLTITNNLKTNQQ